MLWQSLKWNGGQVISDLLQSIQFAMSYLLLQLRSTQKVVDQGFGYFSYNFADGSCLARRTFSVNGVSTFREIVAFHETWAKEENLVKFHGQRIAHATDFDTMLVQTSETKWITFIHRG